MDKVLPNNRQEDVLRNEIPGLQRIFLQICSLCALSTLGANVQTWSRVTNLPLLPGEPLGARRVHNGAGMSA